MEKDPFSGATDSPSMDFVWPSPWVQSQGGSLICPPTCLPAVNLRVTSSATPALSTNRGVHCTRVYTAGLLSGHPSCKQWRAGNGVLLTCAAARFDLVLPAQKANVLPTRPHRSATLVIVILFTTMLFHRYYIKSALQYSLCRRPFSVSFHFWIRSHLLPDQLPGKHTGDMAAVWAFLLQHINLGKHALFLHLSHDPFP